MNARQRRKIRRNPEYLAWVAWARRVSEPSIPPGDVLSAMTRRIFGVPGTTTHWMPLSTRPPLWPATNPSLSLTDIAASEVRLAEDARAWASQIWHYRPLPVVAGEYVLRFDASDTEDTTP